MEHTSFSINDLSADALVPLRDDDGNLSDVSELMPTVTDGPYLGGGGLYSNVGDYMKFMRMVLRNGQDRTEKFCRVAWYAICLPTRSVT